MAGPPPWSLAGSHAGAAWLQEGPTSRGRLLLRGLLALLLPAAAFLLFMANGTHDFSGDVRPNAELSWWVSEGHPPTFRGHPAFPPGSKLGYEFFRLPDGTVGPFFPAGTALYGAAGFRLLKAAGVVVPLHEVPQRGKPVTAAMMALLVLAVWWTLLVFAGDRAAVLGALLVGGASPVVSHFAQGFWVQGGALLSQALAAAALATAVVLARAERIPIAAHAAVFAAGAFALWAIVCRPTFLVWAVPFIGASLLLLRRPLWGSFACGLVVGAAWGAWWNLHSQGSPLGVYFQSQTGAKNQESDPARMAAALAALLASPARGLFVYLPWTFLAVVALALLLRRRWRSAWLLAHGAAAVALLALIAKHKIWYGGWSHGPRLQCDALLCILFLLGPLFEALARRWLGVALLLALGAPAAFLQQRAAHMLRDHWEATSPSISGAPWDWERSDLLWYATNGANARAVRREGRPPTLPADGVLRAGPDHDRFVFSGFEPAARSAGVLQPRNRVARLAVEVPATWGAEGEVLLTALPQWRPEHARRRSVELHVAGTRAAVWTLEGDAPCTATLSLEALRRRPFAVLELHEPDPPQSRRGDEFQAWRELRFTPPAPPTSPSPQAAPPPAPTSRPEP